MFSSQRRIIRVSVSLILVLLLSLKLVNGNAPAIVKEAATPTPDAKALRLAEEVRKEHEAAKADSIREVIEEGHIDDREQQEESEEKDSQFNTLTDLLAWAVEASQRSNETNFHMAPEFDNLGSLDDLLEVMEESVSSSEVMQEALITLRRESVKEIPDLDEVTEALSILEDLCHNIDNANDLIAMEEFRIVPELLNSSQASIRWNTALLVATCMQNNAFVQQTMIQSFGIFDKLVTLFIEDESEKVREKTIFALLCLAENVSVRSLFEGDQRVVRVLERGVCKNCSSRIVRRALNMGEVLLRHQGSFWRPKLVGLGKVAEELLKLSDDEYIRESAAEFVKQLYSSDK